MAGGEVKGEIVGMEEEDSNVFLVRARAQHPHSAGDLESALQSGAISWRDLEVPDAVLRLRVALLDKMRPPPRVELEVQHGPIASSLQDVAANGARCSVDDEYFKSYEDIGTHELMLRDRPRMEAYRDAIMRNAEAIRGKIVLDVGCGTGILSMIAAKAGAKRVFAVEASGMAVHATKLVEHNTLSQTVTVLHGRMEDVELPEKVDVIISEWMGFYLLHESMLSSVLYARDCWLKDGGLLLPSHATLYACPVSMDQYRQETEEFWSDVCGLDLSPFGQVVAARAAAPVVKCIDQGQLLAQPATVASIDCGAVTSDQLKSIRKNLSFPVCKAGRLAGIALWFDCHFEVRSHTDTALPQPSRKRSRTACGWQGSSPAAISGQGDETDASQAAAGGEGGGGGRAVLLSTSPASAPTHWMQTIVMLGVYAQVAEGAAVDVTVAVEQDPANPRVYSISINT